MYLEVKDLKKSYGEGGGYVQVLKGITAGVEKGEMCVIQGTSGSGKSTLLNCIGGWKWQDLEARHCPIIGEINWDLFFSFIIWCRT